MSDMLRSALGVAVPLWVMDLKKLPWEKIEKIAHESAQVVAEKGDILQFGGKRKGETAAAFNALAKGLAALSFCPGGVTFLGDHYENEWPITSGDNMPLAGFPITSSSESPTR